MKISILIERSLWKNFGCWHIPYSLVSHLGPVHNPIMPAFILSKVASQRHITFSTSQRYRDSMHHETGCQDTDEEPCSTVTSCDVTASWPNDWLNVGALSIKISSVLRANGWHFNSRWMRIPLSPAQWWSLTSRHHSSSSLRRKQTRPLARWLPIFT